MTLLGEFKELYWAAPHIGEMKPRPDDYNWVALTHKTGLPAAIVSSEKYLEHLPLNETYYPFFNESKVFWLIPIDTYEGNIIGFVMRSFMGKAFRVVQEPGTPQVLLGWETFSDYQGQPLLFTEGFKDLYYLKQFYPYSLALLSSGLSKEILQLIRALRPHGVIFCLDNDESGITVTRFLEKHFQNEGVQTASLLPKEEDYGEYWKNRTYFDRLFQAQLNGCLRCFGLQVINGKLKEMDYDSRSDRNKGFDPLEADDLPF